MIIDVAARQNVFTQCYATLQRRRHRTSSSQSATTTYNLNVTLLSSDLSCQGASVMHPAISRPLFLLPHRALSHSFPTKSRCHRDLARSSFYPHHPTFENVRVQRMWKTLQGHPVVDLSRHKKTCEAQKALLKSGSRKFTKAYGAPKASRFNLLISGHESTKSPG